MTRVSILTALMALLATPVTASTLVEACVLTVEWYEQAFDDRRAGLSRLEIEIAVAAEIVATFPNWPDEFIKAIAQEYSSLVYFTPVSEEREFLAKVMKDCFSE